MANRTSRRRSPAVRLSPADRRVLTCLETAKATGRPPSEVLRASGLSEPADLLDALYPTPRIAVDVDELINALSKARRATHLTRICLEESDTIVCTMGAEDKDTDMGAAILDVLDQAHDALADAHAYLTKTAFPKGGAK